MHKTHFRTHLNQKYGKIISQLWWILGVMCTKCVCRTNINLSKSNFFFVCFVALHPKSTAMVMAGRSVHLTTLFPGQAWTSSWPVLRAHTFTCNWQQPFLNDSAEGRMTVEIISWSISTKVWDRAGIKLATPGFAVRLSDTLSTPVRGPAKKNWHNLWLCWYHLLRGTVTN